MIGSIIGWILFGLVAGAVAKLLYPGDQGLGWVGTMMLGIVGSLVGGGLAYVLRLGTSPYEPAGWIMSVIGALVLLSMGFFSSRRRLEV